MKAEEITDGLSQTVLVAEKAMDKFIKSGSKTHSLDEVMNDLGMDTRVL